MTQLLAEKELKHALLLRCLGEGGVLHALPKEVLRYTGVCIRVLACAQPDVCINGVHVRVCVWNFNREGGKAFLRQNIL